MSGLIPLDACLARALDGTNPVPPETLPLAQAMGHALAQDLLLPHDLPTNHEALRAGFAVNALAMMGASPSMPLPLGDAPPLLPGAALPQGSDAILPVDQTQTDHGQPEAIHTPDPGEGVRRAGHDGREGDTLLRAGQCIGARQQMLAGLAGCTHATVRRPRVQVAPDLPLAAFVARWAQSQGALITDDAPHLRIRAAQTHQPRLALNPGDTAWLERGEDALVLDLPPRFDAVLAALLALALPVLAALAGRVPQPVVRPVTRKIASAIGLSEVVLLTRTDSAWMPGPAGTVTLTGLARADAFALIPPDSEGIAAQTPLPGLPLENPLG